MAGLLTTYDRASQNVPIQNLGLRDIQRQAAAAWLPLQAVPLDWPCPNSTYEALLKDTAKTAVSQGFTHLAFGDLFLAEIRAYRERLFADTGLTLLFPRWGLETGPLAQAMLASGLKAVVTAVDESRLASSLLGRAFDAAFLDALPAGCDPCGENGEFHTFCHAGPMFCYDLLQPDKE